MESDRSPLKQVDHDSLKPDNSDMYKTSCSHFIPDSLSPESDQVPNPACLVSSIPPIHLANADYVFPDTMPIMTDAQMQKLQRISSISKRISWLAIVDCILVSFIMYFGIFYLIIIVILLPVVGFFSSRRYHRGLSWFYLCYSVVILAMRCGLIVIFPSIPVFVIQGLIILLEAYIVYSVIRFLRDLKHIFPNERDFLLGRPYSPNNQVNESGVDACVEVIFNPPPLYSKIDFRVLSDGK
jgi:hypothetical protein